MGSSQLVDRSQLRTMESESVEQIDTGRYPHPLQGSTKEDLCIEAQARGKKFALIINPVLLYSSCTLIFT